VIKKKRINNFTSYMSRHWGLYMMLMLPLAFFFVFSYMPMGNLLIAFMRNNILISVYEAPWERWVGLDNFRQAFNNPFFIRAVRNTVMFSVLDFAVGFPAPIILALLLNELKFRHFKRVTQTISYMPFFLSWVIIGGLAIRMFSPTDGSINNIIVRAGFDPIPFINQNNPWIATNVMLSVWRHLGWNTIIYLAAITGVNPELYEAADMDGATRIQKMWNVTLPGIRPVILILFILTMGQIMGADMARFLALENLLVRDVSTIVPIFVWRWGLQGSHFSFTAAVGLVMSVVNLTLLFIANYGARKFGGSGLW